MIVLNQKAFPRTTGSSSSALPVLSRQKAQSIAEATMRRGISKAAWHALDQLYRSGIMTVSQISLARRTLRKYAKERLITRSNFSPKAVAKELRERFLPIGDGQLYTLGSVGVEILFMRYGLRPTLNYLAYPFERVLPALILNEIVQRIETEAAKHDWSLTRHSFEQAQLIREERIIFSPSALISLEQEKEQHFFAIEYHDEARSGAIWKKVQHYENANETGLWEEKWLGESFPIVLAVFQHNRIGEYYRDAISEMGGMQTSFYGRSLEGLARADSIGTWVNIEKGSRENIFPWLA